ncbi:MAG: FAD-dependent oxidoreductase, partial [Lachnospiraceae bacterium]
ASNVFGLRNLSDAQAINQLVTTESKVLIVGSGLVGLDAAYAFLRRNMSVTIVEMVDKILPLQLDDRAAGAYQKLFEEAGCKFLLNKKATTTTMSGNKITQVVLDDGTALECDLVIVAAGVRPAIECIASAAIEGERKVDVNAHLQTNHPDIYAAGDVAGLSGIWPNAMKQGKIAAMNMCGNSVLYEDCYAMKNTINFYGLTTLSLGKTTVEEGDEVCICEERTNYKKAIFRHGKLRGIILQGDIRYCGIYQYLIKNEMDLKELSTQIFHLSFAEFFHVAADGEYRYSC